MFLPVRALLSGPRARFSLLRVLFGVVYSGTINRALTGGIRRGTFLALRVASSEDEAISILYSPGSAVASA